MEGQKQETESSKRGRTEMTRGRDDGQSGREREGGKEGQKDKLEGGEEDRKGNK